jgi:ABC-type glutathione transport system ATPase component
MRMTLLFTSHRLDFVGRIGDRIAVMHAGSRGGLSPSITGVIELRVAEELWPILSKTALTS